MCSYPVWLTQIPVLASQIEYKGMCLALRDNTLIMRTLPARDAKEMKDTLDLQEYVLYCTS